MLFGAGKQGEWQYLLCCNLQCCLVQASKASGNIYFVVICSVVFGAGKQGEWQYLLCCNLQCCLVQARRWERAVTLLCCVETECSACLNCRPTGPLSLCVAVTSALFPGTTARAVSLGPFDWLLVALDIAIGTRALAVRV